MTLFQTLDAFSFLKPSVARKVVIEAGQMATLILHPQFPETQSRVTPPAGDHDAKEHSTISAIAIISACLSDRFSSMYKICDQPKLSSLAAWPEDVGISDFFWRKLFLCHEILQSCIYEDQKHTC